MSKSRQHEFSQALYDIIYHALLNQSVNKEQAIAIAEESADTVLDEFGGENLYIPKNISGKATAVIAKSMMSSRVIITKPLPKSMA